MPLKKPPSYSTADEEPMINLTPLIDVVFVILIMFMVIAPLLEIDRVELAQKGESYPEKKINLQEESLISIHVFKDNSIRYNNQEVGLPQLKRHLIQAKGKFPGVRPHLFHDKEASFGTYQSIKNALESAGFEELDVVLTPE